jgi:CopG antitoxin of type II toxin-antitoxin system
MKKRNLPPKFKSEAQERKFWESHDTADYFDLSKAVQVRFPNLKPSTTAISLRLPVIGGLAI